MEEEEVGEEGGSRERRGTRVGGKTLALKRQKSREHFARVRLGSQYVTLPCCALSQWIMDSILATWHGATGQCDILTQ